MTSGLGQRQLVPCQRLSIQRNSFAPLSKNLGVRKLLNISKHNNIELYISKKPVALWFPRAGKFLVSSKRINTMLYKKKQANVSIFVSEQGSKPCQELLTPFAKYHEIGDNHAKTITIRRNTNACLPIWTLCYVCTIRTRCAASKDIHRTHINTPLVISQRCHGCVVQS